MGEIPIIKLTPLKQDRNPYLREDMEYFLKRKQILIDAKFRALMYKMYEHKCPMCKESLHNGEPVELHHIVPQKSGGKYSIENILPLHQICHQQVTHGNKTLERLKIALTPLDENQTAEDKNKKSQKAEELRLELTRKDKILKKKSNERTD